MNSTDRAPILSTIGDPHTPMSTAPSMPPSRRSSTTTNTTTTSATFPSCRPSRRPQGESAGTFSVCSTCCQAENYFTRIGILTHLPRSSNNVEARISTTIALPSARQIYGSRSHPQQNAMRTHPADHPHALLRSARSPVIGKSNNTLTITTFLFSRPLLAPPHACSAKFGVFFCRTAGHLVRTQHGVTASAGQRRGDVEVRSYLRDQAGSR